MLSRSFRLKKREVKRVYQKGETYKAGGLTLRFLANRAGNFRVAIVIPKATLPHATDRNRLKRKTAEALKTMKLASFDFIISFKSKITEENLQNALTSLLGRITLK